MYRLIFTVVLSLPLLSMDTPGVAGEPCIGSSEYLEIEIAAGQKGCDGLTSAHLAIRSGTELTAEDYSALAAASPGIAQFHLARYLIGAGDDMFVPLLDISRFLIVDQYGLSADNPRAVIYFYEAHRMLIDRLAIDVKPDRLGPMQAMLDDLDDELGELMGESFPTSADRDRFLRCFITHDHLSLDWSAIVNSDNFTDCLARDL